MKIFYYNKNRRNGEKANCPAGANFRRGGESDKMPAGADSTPRPETGNDRENPLFTCHCTEYAYPPAIDAGGRK